MSETTKFINVNPKKCQQVWYLDEEEGKKFLELLENPPEFSKAVRQRWKNLKIRYLRVV